MGRPKSEKESLKMQKVSRSPSTRIHFGHERNFDKASTLYSAIATLYANTWAPLPQAYFAGELLEAGPGSFSAARV